MATDSHGCTRTGNLKTLAVVMAICFARSAHAQSSALAFEVASVRLADPAGSSGPPVRTSPHSKTDRNFSLRNCVQMAYETVHITAPAWLSDVRLDIVAKAAAPVDDKQLHLMLRALLAERLGLKVHFEPKEMSVYALTLAKGGPKFSETTTEGPPAGQGKGGVFNMQRVSMSDFAIMLSQSVDRPVVDATGLKGRYDLRLDSAPYRPAPNADGSPGAPADPAAIMITALQEQLGLKVESRKEKVDFLVVDHAGKVPSEN